jgi:hypothetical protein
LSDSSVRDVTDLLDWDGAKGLGKTPIMALARRVFYLRSCKEEGP